VRGAVSSAVLSATYRGYELPPELVELIQEDVVITPEWVSQQLDDLLSGSFEQPAEQLEYYDSEPPSPLI
jgi:hypothetical protein